MKLKTKLSKLRHDGHITDAEYSIITNALNRKPKERVISEIKIDEDTLRKLVKDEADELTTKFATQPCEDCISRQELLEELGEEPFNWNDSPEALQEVRDYQWFKSLVENAPLITPKTEPCEDVLDKIKAEILEKFDNCSICEWFENYDYDENDISEYMSVGHILDIIDIIDKYIEGSDSE